MLIVNTRRIVASLLIPLVVGLAAYWLVTGGAMLSPSNVAWLQQGDLAQSYYGWAFYRHDLWTLPFGANPSYGMEFHSSVYYSDSVPLVAMLFKLIAAWLPEPFQYFGLWFLLCFVLQAFFAFRILSIATANTAARILGCVFFVLAPPMLFRLASHIALVGHWTILAALYLYLRPTLARQRLWWTVLVSISMLVEPYIFVMVAAIWAADLVRRYQEAKRLLPPGARLVHVVYLQELIQVPLITALAAWLAGGFMVASGGWAMEGFGIYKMNVLSIINGDGFPLFNGKGWSKFGLHFPMAWGEYEGFNYLGVGGLFLLLVAIIVWINRRQQSLACGIVWPLVAVCVLLTLAAITPNVGVGTLQWHLPLPAKLESRLTHLSFRTTGRLFWVPYYAILVGVFFALARALSTRWLLIVLSVGVALQLTDLHAGITNLRTMLMARADSGADHRLHGPFWTAAASHYRHVRRVPSIWLGVDQPGWELLAQYANENGMTTDVIRTGRVDSKLFNMTRMHQLQLIAQGHPEAQTLYVLDASEVAVASKSVGPGDALFALDGFNVLAPNWQEPLPKGAVNLK